MAIRLVHWRRKQTVTSDGLYEDRKPLYSRADYRVEVDTEDVEELIHRILKLPLFG